MKQAILKPSLLVLLIGLVAMVHTDLSAREKELPEMPKRLVVERLKNALAQDSRAEVAALFEYPFKRKYPIPDIRSAEEMVIRFEEVFGDDLISAIRASNFDENWSKMGTKGTMLNSGQVWLHDTRHTIIAINEKSPLDAVIRRNLIEFDKQRLHESLRDFESPALEWLVGRYRIRVDRMPDGTYRYASWDRNVSVLNAPELVVKGGTVHYEGSAGNHFYEFKQGKYTYKVSVFFPGRYGHLIEEIGNGIGILEVKKTGETLLKVSADHEFD